MEPARAEGLAPDAVFTSANPRGPRPWPRRRATPTAIIVNGGGGSFDRR
jgi:hypothetical protein